MSAEFKEKKMKATKLVSKARSTLKKHRAALEPALYLTTLVLSAICLRYAAGGSTAGMLFFIPTILSLTGAASLISG